MSGHAPIGALVDLSRDERVTLAECEQRIQRGMSSFLDVGLALTTIREQRLYRATHASFEAYCAQVWGFSGRRGRQLIDAAEVGTTVPVTSERQARELARVPAPDRSAILAEATARGRGKATAETIREVVNDSAAGKDGAAADGAGRSSGAALPPPQGDSSPIPPVGEESPAPKEESPAPKLDPELVWVGPGRRANGYHKPGLDRFTHCGWSTRMGRFITTSEARQAGAEPCPRCWTAVGDNAPAPAAEEAAAATVVSGPASTTTTPAVDAAPAPVPAITGAGVTPGPAPAPGTEAASPTAVPGPAEAEAVPGVSAGLARRLDIALEQYSTDLGHLAVLLHQAGGHAGDYLQALRRHYTDLGELLRFLEGQ